MPPRRGVDALFTMIVLPASVNPLLKVRSLGANRGIQAVARKNDGVVGEREQFRINGMENGGEIAAVEFRVAGTAGEQGVASEK